MLGKVNANTEYPKCFSIPASERFKIGKEVAESNKNDLQKGLKSSPDAFKIRLADAALTGDTAFLKGVNAGVPKTVPKSVMFFSKVASLVIKLLK